MTFETGSTALANEYDSLYAINIILYTYYACTQLH